MSFAARVIGRAGVGIKRAEAMEEARATRIRRLRLRSMRRGIREMDLILSAFAEAALETLPEAELARYDALLAENDHDLYQWISGQAAPPARFAPLVLRIAAHAQGSVRQV
jgi:antitoxin CptB